MIERKQSFNRESQLSAKKASCLCGMNENKEARKKTGCLCRKVARNKERKKEVILSFGLSTWNERKPSVNLCKHSINSPFHSKNVILLL